MQQYLYTNATIAKEIATIVIEDDQIDNANTVFAA